MREQRQRVASHAAPPEFHDWRAVVPDPGRDGVAIVGVVTPSRY